MKNVQRPLKQGTVITFMSMAGTVVQDNGNSLEVMVDGVVQTWDWEVCGVRCQISGS